MSGPNGRRAAGFALAVVLGAAAVAACSEDEDLGDVVTTGGFHWDEEEVQLSLREVAELEWPTALAQRPDSDLLYVTEQAGRVRVIDGTELDPEPVLDITDVIRQQHLGEETGLLGLAFHPEEPLAYLSFTEPQLDDAGDPTGFDRVIAEYAFDEDAGILDPASRRDVLTVQKDSIHHNGGMITFGPDGYLYGGFGDDSPEADSKEQGQDPSTLLATMWRIDPLGDADGEYSVPDDNPFVDEAEGAPEVWLYGVRNPWHFTFDPETGDLWLPDVGDLQVEEVNHLPASEGWGRGGNLGWSLFEGDEPRGDQVGQPPPEDYLAPIHAYRLDEHPEWCAIIGGQVYRGDAIPDLEGAYLFGDFCGRSLLALRLDEDGEAVVHLSDMGLPQGLLSSGQGHDGEVYLLLIDGVYRLDGG